MLPGLAIQHLVRMAYCERFCGSSRQSRYFPLQRYPSPSGWFAYRRGSRLFPTDALVSGFRENNCSSHFGSNSRDRTLELRSDGRVFERRYCVRGAKDRCRIIGEVDFQCRPHLFPLVAGDRILHQGDVVSQLCGVTHRRFDAGIRLLAYHNQLVDAMLLKLEIQVCVRETAGAPVFLRNHFAGQWREFFAKGSAPGSCSEDASFVGEFLNGCDVLPALDFILGPQVSVMRCEEDPYACGTGGQKDGKHVRYALNRFCYLLYQRP